MDLLIVILTILFGGLGVYFIQRYIDGPEKKVITNNNNYFYNRPQKPPQNFHRIQNNLSVGSTLSNKIESYNLQDIISNLNEKVNYNDHLNNKKSLTKSITDLKKSLNWESMWDNNLRFNPSETTVTKFNDNTILLSDKEKAFFSNPEDKFKVGIYNPTGLPMSIYETNDEWIFRIKKNKKV